MPETIDAGQWNRTLLARQHLLDRVDEEAVEVLDRCVGLQSQDPQAPFVGLWSRIAGFDPAEVDELLVDRELVRMALQRGTVFLMDGLDARWIRTAVQPVLEAGLRQNHLRRLSADPAQVVEVALSAFGATEEALPSARIRELLAAQWPDDPAEALAAVVRARLPLVQVPPRGLWRHSGGLSYRLLDDWIGPGEPAVTGDEAGKDLIRMYLRGYGPATAGALGVWSGLTGLSGLLREMADDWELVELTGPDGQALYDLDGLPIVDGATPAPVRLIAPYDNVLVANGDRDRLADAALYRATVTPNGRSPGFVLADGRLAGTWAREADRVVLTQLRDLSAAERSAAEGEARRLEDFLAR